VDGGFEEGAAVSEGIIGGSGVEFFFEDAISALDTPVILGFFGGQASLSTQILPRPQPHRKSLGQPQTKISQNYDATTSTITMPLTPFFRLF
jgi:hypothetical protein